MEKEIPLKKQKKRGGHGILALAVAALVIIASMYAYQSCRPVEVVYDAMRFVVNDGGPLRTITEDELVALIGEPDSIDEFSYTGTDSLSYPIRSLSYHSGQYEYEFNNNYLARIHIFAPVPFEKKYDILAKFGLHKYADTAVNDTGYAYRAYNCGIHDLWCIDIADGKIGQTYITYMNFFS